MSARTIIGIVTLASAAGTFAYIGLTNQPESGSQMVSPQSGTFEFVFASGLDRGPVGDTNSYGVIETDVAPAVGLMEWQTSVKRTGDGAYHFVGGTSTSEKEIAGGQSGSDIFGGLEAWHGGAFRFASFPNSGVPPAWIMVFVPSDGVAGADHKPVAAITSSGKLRLLHSNDSSIYDETATTLALHKWYYILLHGLNGTDKTQEIYLYDGDNGALIEKLEATWTVGGTFVNKIAKWGFGTNSDTAGVEFYVDDLFFSRGDVNPGPMRVFPRVPTGTAASGGFTASGAPTNHEAIDEWPTDGDSSYTQNNTASTSNHQIEFDLSPSSLGSSDIVRAVQSMIVVRSTGLSPTVSGGLKVGSSESLANLTANSTYRARYVFHTTNPATGAAWQPTEVNSFKGVVKDNDAVTREFRVTNAWWDMVYTQTVGSTPLPPPSPAPSPSPSPSPPPSPGASPSPGSSTPLASPPPPPNAPKITQVKIDETTYDLPLQSLQVEKGKDMTLIGTAQRNETVTIYVTSIEKEFSTTADSSGNWTFDVWTRDLEEESHHVDLASAADARYQALTFVVVPLGQGTVVVEAPSPVPVPSTTASPFPLLPVLAALAVLILVGGVTYLVIRRRRLKPML